MAINVAKLVVEINVIMSALGNAPYAQVHEPVTKIRSQVEPQIQNMPIGQPTE